MTTDPGREERRSLDSLSARDRAELDRWVVGQTAAKRAWRSLSAAGSAAAGSPGGGRRRHPQEHPHDRTHRGGQDRDRAPPRAAGGSPFVKVEASKFTEVGYVGRDVDAIVRDLVAAAVDMVRREKQAEVGRRRRRASRRGCSTSSCPRETGPGEAPEAHEARCDAQLATREKLRVQLRAGQLEGRAVEVDVPERTMPTFQILGSQGAEEMDVAIRDMLPGLFGSRTKRRSLPVAEARTVLRQEEEARLVDQDQVSREAVERAESAGIVFLDEIDKIAGRESVHGPDVSREGVQRDLLPIVEGTTVSTKYGPVRTDHVLFIAAGPST